MAAQTIDIRLLAGVAASLTDQLTTLKSLDGVVAVYVGPQRENPSLTVLVTHWASPSAYETTSASDAYKAFAASLDTSATTIRQTVLAVSASDAPTLPIVLGSAPTTEFFTGFGAEPAFYDNAQEFLSRVNATKLDGVHGGLVAKAEFAVVEEGRDSGSGVLVVIGWDSAEKHAEEKGKPGNPIIANIALLRSGISSVELFHTNLEKV